MQISTICFWATLSLETTVFTSSRIPRLSIIFCAWAAHGLPVNRPQPGCLRPAQKDVFRDGQRFHQFQFLVHHAQPKALRLQRRFYLNRLPPKEEAAGSRRMDPRQDLDQCGFSGAVLADQRMYVPAPAPGS